LALQVQKNAFFGAFLTIFRMNCLFQRRSLRKRCNL